MHPSLRRQKKSN